MIVTVCPEKLEWLATTVSALSLNCAFSRWGERPRELNPEWIPSLSPGLRSYPGKTGHDPPTLKGLQNPGREGGGMDDATLTGLGPPRLPCAPRVASPTRQPWAKRGNPVGIRDGCPDPALAVGGAKAPSPLRSAGALQNGRAPGVPGHVPGPARGFGKRTNHSLTRFAPGAVLGPQVQTQDPYDRKSSPRMIAPNFLGSLKC